MCRGTLLATIVSPIHLYILGYFARLLTKVTKVTVLLDSWLSGPGSESDGIALFAESDGIAKVTKVTILTKVKESGPRAASSGQSYPGSRGVPGSLVKNIKVS